MQSRVDAFATSNQNLLMLVHRASLACVPGNVAAVLSPIRCKSTRKQGAEVSRDQKYGTLPQWGGGRKNLLSDHRSELRP